MWFHPNPPTMSLNDFLADRQTDAISGVLAARVQALEHRKNGLRVFGGNSNSVVANRKLPGIRPSRGLNLDLRNIAATELYCVANEILEYLFQLRAIRAHCGQKIMGHLSPAPRNRRLQAAECTLYHCIAVDGVLNHLGPSAAGK